MNKNLLVLTVILLFSHQSIIFAQDKPEVAIDGALRFNYNYSNWKEGQQKRGGDFGYDVFRINPTAAYKGITLNAEFRWYSDAFGGAMLKQGWMGYKFSESDEIQLGLTQVPFGNKGYNSHNWFFSINYYVGLEDDHDMGVKYIHDNDKWDIAVAFFKNAEELQFGSDTDVSNSRYGYDIGSIDENGDGTLQYRNKEVNQLNARVIRKFGDKVKHQLGISGMFGGLYNLDTEGMGNHYAGALHYDVDYKRWNLKAQLSYYKKSPNAPDGERTDVVAMTAYGAPYLVAAEGATYTLGVSYDQPVEWGPISSLLFYNDFGMLDKTEEEFYDSYQNVTGCMITAGMVYIYMDAAFGKDQPWLGPVWNNALAYGTMDAEWFMRFNINFGFYF
ncbi:hypothetical protein [Flammeovirga kamogawensis]|uniref:Uncharacterized protein n=1 Tax=Flammeovirga kamogawensis TaxID=373891 RepID=A0ABX8GY18_9BACT|nr:hypothetical protein [Flammeovirga kamogawensis]MBB6460883.1 hypothetical protein [Flammeovirga kamogawensis]QWG08228.1 hypothetical protein KM029_04635 [Flammeovirga kamogawensis]TRX70031.1 hypothetical protein EO216_18570 [Flammeovirga kamogawensis]